MSQSDDSFAHQQPGPHPPSGASQPTNGAQMPHASQPAYAAQVPSAPQPGYAAAAQVPPASQPAYAVPAEPRRRRVWPWVVSGVVLVVLLFGCVGASVAALMKAAGDDVIDGDTVAVIPLQGAISGSSSGQSGEVSPEDFVGLLKRAEEDSKVKAVVLRVDSPGGTVAASQEIAAYVKTLRKSKPVVVSVGDLDASGAYMVSSQANQIVANPGSAVGSIGVIMEIPNASRLMDKIGLEFKVISAGKYKDAGSPFRPVTPEETAMLQDQIDEIYGQFIDMVAEGRKLPRSEVESMATGWVWTGTQAKKMGLVDKVGTYQDALDLAARLGHIEGDYNTDVYDESDLSDFFDLLSSVESFMRGFSTSAAAAPASTRGAALAR